MSKDLIPQTNSSLELSGQLPQDALQSAMRQYGMGNDWLLLPDGSDKNHISRLELYVAWLDITEGHWTQPALVEYAAYLQSEERVDKEGQPLEKLASTSVKSHLSTIRGRYSQLIRNPDFKRRLRELADRAYPAASLADRRALTLTMLDDLQDALNPELVKLRVVKKQDEVDSEHLRLTKQQAESLIAQPDLETYRGLRDAALLVFLLCTGLREAELCQLDVRDLRQTVEGKLGVRVREGKGAKQRFVPYGNMDFCLSYLDAWLAQAGINSGAVFRGFKDRHLNDPKPKNRDKVAVGNLSPSEVAPRLTERLTTRAVQDILKKYPVMINGEQVNIRPHDMRRTYAKLCWDMGMDLNAIRDNLGHSDSKITQRYIGEADMDKRLTPALLQPQHDLKQLQRLGMKKLL